MATSLLDQRNKDMGQLKALKVRAQLITSGTTVTFSLAAGTPIWAIFFHNETTDAVDPVGGTYDIATGVWVSPTMALNDIAAVTFVTE